MKKNFLASIALAFFTVSITLFQLSSGSKAVAQTKTSTVHIIDTVIHKCPSSIVGLWEGTYTEPNGTSFYFSFSIHPDGTVSYRSKGRYQGSDNYTNFADGIWILNGTNFSFSVTTVNDPLVTTQLMQIGSATYNQNNATLTNGIVVTPNHGSAVWTMKKVN